MRHIQSYLDKRTKIEFEAQLLEFKESEYEFVQKAVKERIARNKSLLKKLSQAFCEDL